MKIENLMEKDTVLDDDYLIVDGTDGTKKAKKSTFLSEVNSRMVPEELTDFFTPAEGIAVYDSHAQAYKIGNIVQVSIDLHKTNKGVFNDARTFCGTLSLGGTLNQIYSIAGASSEITGHINRTVGCIIKPNGQISVDLQDNDTDVKYINIMATLFIL